MVSGLTRLTRKARSAGHLSKIIRYLSDLLIEHRLGFLEVPPRLIRFSSKGNEVEKLLEPPLVFKELKVDFFLAMIPVRDRALFAGIVAFATFRRITPDRS